MPSFVVVEKLGSLKQQITKSLDLADLSKKCGFKTADGFSCAHVWTVNFNELEYKLAVYGKTTGRANSENKFEFPPPIDNVLFFGNCAAVLSVDSDVIVDMTTEEFSDILESLFGGFSDIGSEDSEEEVDDDDEGLPKTKQGYVKDDFVVSSEEEDEDEVEEEEVEEEVKPKKDKKKVIAKPKKPKLRDEVEITICCEELEEEPYV
jgi:hypothetical protein